jgi:hypothetical protein
MGEACSTHERVRNAYKILVGKLKGGGHSEDIAAGGRMILKLDLGETCWEGVDQKRLA